MVKVKCDTQKLTEQVFDILVIDDGITGAWTALGAKFTTDYRLREMATQLAEEKLGRQTPRSRLAPTEPGF